MCQTIGLCAVSQTGFCSSRGGGTKLSGKANFLLHFIMIHLVTEILERTVSEEADVKVNAISLNAGSSYINMAGSA